MLFLGILLFSKRLPIKLDAMFDQGVVLFRLVLSAEISALSLPGQRIVPVALPRRRAAFPVAYGHDVLHHAANVPGNRLLDAWALGQLVNIADAHVGERYRRGRRSLGLSRFFGLGLGVLVHLKNDLSYSRFQPARPTATPQAEVDGMNAVLRQNRSGHAGACAQHGRDVFASQEVVTHTASLLRYLSSFLFCSIVGLMIPFSISETSDGLIPTSLATSRGVKPELMRQRRNWLLHNVGARTGSRETSSQLPIIPDSAHSSQPTPLQLGHALLINAMLMAPPHKSLSLPHPCPALAPEAVRPAC